MRDLEDAIFEDWGENPATLGAYSSAGAGSYPDTGPSMREVVGEQIGTELYFAGEATNPTGPAVVIGAMETGERAAFEIDEHHDPVPEPQGSLPVAVAIGVLMWLAHGQRARRHANTPSRQTSKARATER